MDSTHIAGLGDIRLESVDGSHQRPGSPSEYSDWGELAPEAQAMPMERWVVELRVQGQRPEVVGDVSAHAVWYGPSPGSRAVNIGIGLVEPFRGRGIGSVAQRMLAQLLHDRGVVRVEASTDVDNIAEQRSLERAGFSYEGTLRLAQERRDGRHDLQVWSHIRP